MLNVTSGSNSSQKGIRISRSRQDDEAKDLVSVDLFLARQDFDQFQELLYVLRVPKSFRQEVLGRFLELFNSK